MARAAVYEFSHLGKLSPAASKASFGGFFKVALHSATRPGAAQEFVHQQCSAAKMWLAEVTGKSVPIMQPAPPKPPSIPQEDGSLLVPWVAPRALKRPLTGGKRKRAAAEEQYVQRKRVRYGGLCHPSCI